VDLITGFYAAFARRDWAPMAAAYRPEASFRDPVFRLEGWRIGAMWRMLCERGVDLRIEARVLEASDRHASAYWEAWYRFSASGRPVHNRIEAKFLLQDGTILEHQDSFSLYRWASQALGPRGRLLGWLPPVRHAIRTQAARGLERFIADHGLGRPEMGA
jgi:hypothetical protein